MLELRSWRVSGWRRFDEFVLKASLILKYSIVFLDSENDVVDSRLDQRTNRRDRYQSLACYSQY